VLDSTRNTRFGSMRSGRASVRIRGGRAPHRRPPPPACAAVWKPSSSPRTSRRPPTTRALLLRAAAGRPCEPERQPPSASEKGGADRFCRWPGGCLFTPASRTCARNVGKTAGGWSCRPAPKRSHWPAACSRRVPWTSAGLAGPCDRRVTRPARPRFRTFRALNSVDETASATRRSRGREGRDRDDPAERAEKHPRNRSRDVGQLRDLSAVTSEKPESGSITAAGAGSKLQR